MISKTNVKHFFNEFSCLSTTLSQIKHLDHKIFLIPSLQKGRPFGQPIICSMNRFSDDLSDHNRVRRNHVILNVLCRSFDFATDTLIPGYAHRSDSVSGSSLSVLSELMPGVKYEKLVSYDGDDLLDGEEAFEFMAERIASAAKLAWDNRQNGAYAQGFGRAAVGMCRRVCYNDGSAKMWGDTDTATFAELEGGNDSGIELLFTYDENKKLTGVVANAACPAQVLEHRSFISSDYWGKVKELLRKEYGEDIFLLALCSAAGDQCPRDMIRWVEPESPIDDPNIVRGEVTKRVADPSMFDVKGCELVARRIANEIFYAYECISEYVSEAEFEHRNLTIDMPLRRVTPAEVEALLFKGNIFEGQIFCVLEQNLLGFSILAVVDPKTVEGESIEIVILLVKTFDQQDFGGMPFAVV